MALQTYLLRAAAALLLVCAVVLAEITKEGGVLVLTDANFQEALDAHPDGLLVEMYAPWCGHCKQLIPEYEKAATELAEKGLEIAKLDATEHKEAAGKYEVQGFPTIKYITKGGKSVDYQGGRTAADIVAYVTKKSGPATLPLASKEEVDKFADGADVVVVGYFKDASSAGASTYSEVAAATDDYTFGIVSDASVIKAAGGVDGSVAVLKKFDEGRADMTVTADTTADELTAFITSSSMRLVTTFSPETARSIFGGNINIHALIFAESMEGALKDAATANAKDNRGELLFVHIPPDEARVAEFFGIETKDFPTMVIADMEGGVKKYLAPADLKLDQAGIAGFVSDFKAGKISPTLKSEEPEDADTAEPVKVVKGKSFKSLVIDTPKSVLVEFYAPWCGHCKSLAPKYDELAAKLADDDSIVIAKMDATANEIDHPGVDVQGFPTLLFFPAGDKESPIPYDDEREVDNMYKWLKAKTGGAVADDADGDDAAAADDADEEDAKDEL